jgi:hypothetical protein
MLIQNLGPDDLYVSDLAMVTTDTGVQITPGHSISVGAGETHYGVSEGTSDVRICGAGTGLFAADAPA